MKWDQLKTPPFRGGLVTHPLAAAGKPFNPEPNTAGGVYTGAVTGGALPQTYPHLPIPPTTAPPGRVPVLPSSGSVPYADPTLNSPFVNTVNRLAGYSTTKPLPYGRDQAAEAALAKTYGAYPPTDYGARVNGLARSLHAANAASPRQSVINMLSDPGPGGTRPLFNKSEYQTDPAAWALFRRIHGGLSVPIGTGTYPYTESDSAPPTADVHLPEKTPNVYPAPAGLIASHEAFHARQIPAHAAPHDRSQDVIGAREWNRPGLQDAVELTPSLTDIPVAAEYARMKQKELGRPVTGLLDPKTGKPPQVPFPTSTYGNRTQDLEYMRQQAQQHGLLTGQKSMAELLNTRAGQAWLKQMGGVDARPTPPGLIKKSGLVSTIVANLGSRLVRDNLIEPADRQYVGPGMALGIGGALASGLLVNHLADKRMKSEPRATVERRKELFSAAKLHKVPSYPMPGLHNAYYAPPDPNSPFADHQRYGYIAYDPSLHRPGILAHELGHASIQEHGSGLSRVNQNELRSIDPIASFITTGGIAPIAGLAAGPIGGAAIGGLAGLLSSAPTLINEYQATHRAGKFLDRAGLNPKEKEKAMHGLRGAYGTYLAGAALAPALVAGGVGLMKRYM